MRILNVLSVAAVLGSGCAYERMGRLNVEAQCWEYDRPEDLDISSCERRGPGWDLGTELLMQDPDGTCWQLPYCSENRIWVEELGWSGWDGETCSTDMMALPPC